MLERKWSWGLGMDSTNIINPELARKRGQTNNKLRFGEWYWMLDLIHLWFIGFGG